MKHKMLKSAIPKRWMNQIKPEHLNNLNVNKEEIELKINNKIKPLSKIKC